VRTITHVSVRLGKACKSERGTGILVKGISISVKGRKLARKCALAHRGTYIQREGLEPPSQPYESCAWTR
jgi:hypothetical protein